MSNNCLDAQFQESVVPETDERSVYIEQISLLYGATVKGLAGILLNTMALVFVLWETLGHLLLIVWSSVNISLAFVAALATILFHRDKQKRKNIVRWHNISLVRLLLSGIALGSLSFFFKPDDPQAHQLFYFFVLGGMTAGSAVLYSSRKRMFMVYAFPVMLPTIFRILTYGHPLYFAAGIVGIIFLAILLSSVRSSNALLLKALSLGFKNQSLARRVLQANEELTQARDQIWGEMKLARKIQTVLLPPKPQIPGYEIAVCMEPASEIGGDYYDVVNVEGYHWLVIGDVSGHGVSAGLVMMMVQTSIQQSLANAPGQSPSSLLESINNIITENIRRLSDDKYMTMTVFAVHDEGNFSFSGLHQDILIFRAASQTVEVIPTDGMWLGVTRNLQGMVANSTFVLSHGDTMLLFTDGVTEGWLRSTRTTGGDREMFGQERLEAQLQEHGNKSCSEIRDAILNKMENCDLADDLTMMVAKRTE